MNVRESRRTRHIVIRLDRGDELPAALVRVLDELEARSAWISGLGALEAAEIAIYDQTSKRYGQPRRIDGACEAIAISGNVATMEGATTVRLSGLLARETDVGLSTIGGQLVWARAFAVEFDVTVFDDVTLTRMADEQTGLPVLTSRPTPGVVATAPVPQEPTPRAPAPLAVVPAISPPPARGGALDAGLRAPAVTLPPPSAPPAPPLPAPPPPAPPAPPPPAPPPPAPSAPPPPAPSAPPPLASPPAPIPHSEAPVMPQRPVKPPQELDVYPEVGDSVVHFHFGECTVITSDGDRIRLRQDRDGRVREVALTMLKIEPPTTLPDGRRHFKLGRKN